MEHEEWIDYTTRHFGFTSEQMARFDEFDDAPLNTWPEACRPFIMEVTHQIGFSGDVLMGALAAWIKAGEPESVPAHDVLYVLEHGKMPDA